MSEQRITVAIDLSSTGKGGGPYTSSSRIMESELNQQIDFKVLHYRTELGRGFSIKRVIDLMKQLRDINPDIVHFSGLQLSGFHIALASLLSGFNKTIVTVRGFSGDALYFNGIKRLILSYILEPLTLVLSRRIVAVSQYVSRRNILKMFRWKSMGVIYNFPPKMGATDSRVKIRKEFGFDDSEVIVVTVARIIKDKGYHILDNAIKQLNHINRVKYLIVGDGSYLQEMKENLSEEIENKKVYCLGHRDDVNRVLKACDIFVLPTLHETLSVALLEASQAELALVASNTGGVPEIVEHEYNGLLVQPGNVRALSVALERVILDEKLRRSFGKRAKDRISEKFSHELIVEKYLKVYESLMN